MFAGRERWCLNFHPVRCRVIDYSAIKGTNGEGKDGMLRISDEINIHYGQMLTSRIATQ